MNRETVEYLKVEVEADVTLDTQPVYFSFDNRATWLAAEWAGAVGQTRVARLLIDETNMPAHSTKVYVRVTDDPEAPVILAGALNIA